MADELGKKMYREKFNEMTICDKCSNYIGLTDVEGHYSGVCKECTDSLPVDKLDALRSDNWSD